MTIEERMEALENLGDFLGQFRRSGIVKQQEIPFNDPYLERLEHAIEQARLAVVCVHPRRDESAPVKGLDLHAVGNAVEGARE